MSTAPRWIQPLEEDVVSRLLVSLPYLAPGSGGTCEAISDVTQYMAIKEASPPFVLVRYAGEQADPPRVIGATPSIRTAQFSFMLYVGALSFSVAGEGTRDNVGGNRGLFGMLDDIYWALEGYLLPSAPYAQAKLFFESNTNPGVEANRVTSLSTFRCSVVRAGDPAVNG